MVKNNIIQFPAHKLKQTDEQRAISLFNNIFAHKDFCGLAELTKKHGDMGMEFFRDDVAITIMIENLHE